MRTCRFCGEETSDPTHWYTHLSASEAADLASIGWVDPTRLSTSEAADLASAGAHPPAEFRWWV